MSPKKDTAVTIFADLTAADKKKAQAGLVTSLKASSDPSKQEVYSLYTSLSRQSAEKANLLNRWLSDKSCKWVNQYKQERSVSNTATMQGFEGHGTVWPT